MSREWPIRTCRKCGQPMRLVRMSTGQWVPYNAEYFVPHVCTRKVKTLNTGLFGPKDDPWKKGLPKGKPPGPGGRRSRGRRA